MFAGYTDTTLIGEGGLGRVYRATRQSTGGLVAIKELREVPSASPAWHRAKRELEAMLRLKGHPYVVSIEEIIDGPSGPCLVMEYLEGGSLADRVASGPMSTAELLLVGQHVTQALGAAHEVGIVHRDVKPHNLLVGSFGQVKVADFGIAALNREAGLRTRTQAFTLAYASPEELDGEGEIGPGADAWSFAATMLHLATGRRPSFRERSMHNDLAEMEQRGPLVLPVTSMLRRCFEVDPAARPRMSELNAGFNAAMAGLGSLGIARLSGLPTPRPGWSAPATVIPAAPDGDTIPRLRPPLPPSSFGPEGVTFPGVDGVGATARPLPVALPPAGDRNSVAAALHHGRRNLLIGAAVALIGLIVVAVVLLTGGSDDATTGETTDAATGDAASGPLLSVDVGGGAVRWATYSPDGTVIATAGEDGMVRLWDSDTGEIIGAPLVGHSGPVNSAEFSPDGRKLVTAGDDSYAIVWDVETGSGRSFGGHGDPVVSATFNRDGMAILYASGHFTRVADLASGMERPFIPEQPEELMWVALDPIDGVLLVTVGRDNTVKFWGYPYAQATFESGRLSADLATVAFSPDGSQVVSASVDGQAVVWNAADATPITTLATSVTRLRSAVFDPRGDIVVTAAEDGTAQLFDARTGELLQTFGGPEGHTGPVRSAVFSPDGTRVLTAGEDGTIKIWQL